MMGFESVQPKIASSGFGRGGSGDSAPLIGDNVEPSKSAESFSKAVEKLTKAAKKDREAIKTLKGKVLRLELEFFHLRDIVSGHDSNK